MILSFLFYAFLLYLAFRLVFGFILPVYRTTRKVRRSFRAMQEQMQQHSRGQQEPAQPSRPAASEPIGGEYIDFEEIK